jgi:ParB-like chromosome segregation protein Spo0J
MAKRKRLTPANPAFLEAAPEVKSLFGAPMRTAPIAGVAREASATAAAEELARSLTEAREQGRMVISVPLDAVVMDYLLRDRMIVQDEEMQTLKDSLRARGQQTPVDLVALGGGRYGLVSGWRRCVALRALHAETGEARFATVAGLLRQPAEQADAYLAMIEENEIRVGLSYFERARIVAKLVEQGVFGSDRAALQTLFQSASRAKRSKIGSFLPVVRHLEDVLRFPEALGERQGLTLGRQLGEDEDFAARLRAALLTSRSESPEAEAALIAQLVKDVTPGAAKTPSPCPPSVAEPRPAERGGYQITDSLSMTAEDGRILLEGDSVDAGFRERLLSWIRAQY